MREDDVSEYWNLLLVASSPDTPERVVRFLAGAVGACGGWVLSRNTVGEECAEIDFEFPRSTCVEMYSVLVAAGVTLSREAHLQMTELCQCTAYLLDTRSSDIVRVQLTVYTAASEMVGSEESQERKSEAA